jgi:phosphoglycolate phosphatase
MNKKKLFKYNTVIFDLDGVLLDSENNMRTSWAITKKKFGLKCNFEKYAKFVGLPFIKILKKLNIKKNLNQIKEFYAKESIKNFNHFKVFKGVKKLLKYLDSNKIKYYIVTSKDKKRTKQIIKKFSIQVKSFHSPKKGLRGKPYPDQLLECIKKNKIEISKSVYIGDTYFDYLSAKSINLDFIFVNYGFGKNKKIYKKVAKNVEELMSKYIIKQN